MEDENESTKIEMVNNEEEIELIDERQDLLSRGKKVVKSKSAKYTFCKGLLIALAVSIFIAMIVQVYSDYSSFLETHSLPPAIHSMSSHCFDDMEDHCMTKSYNSPSCTLLNTTQYTVECKTSKPNHHMVSTNYDHIMYNMSWDESLLITFSEKPERCLHLTIWSI
jgi:hypothetical protein